MTSINETVEQSLQSAGYGQYQQYARPVVTALVDRERQIVGRLIEFAQGSDLNVEQVRSALQECGMEMPQQAQQQQQTANPSMQEGDLGATLGRIEEALSGMVGWARTQGYNPQ